MDNEGIGGMSTHPYAEEIKQLSRFIGEVNDLERIFFKWNTAKKCGHGHYKRFFIKFEIEKLNGINYDAISELLENYEVIADIWSSLEPLIYRIKVTLDKIRKAMQNSYNVKDKSIHIGKEWDER